MLGECCPEMGYATEVVSPLFDTQERIDTQERTQYYTMQDYFTRRVMSDLQPLAALEAVGISKRFGGVHALSDVSLRLFPGEIHAVCGENGAGKSTLMSVLSGAVQSDAGSMTLGEKPYAPSSPLSSAEAGVAMVWQDRSLVPDISVAENIYLGNSATTTAVFVPRRAMQQRARAVLDSLESNISEKAFVRELSAAQQQIVEIAKALALDPKVLILDEPTSSISTYAAEILFSTLISLKERGLAIAYISHQLDEVIRIADRYSVLRDGRFRGEYPAQGMTQSRIVELMTGRDYSHSRLAERKIAATDVVLDVSSLVVSKAAAPVSLQLNRNEVLALTGLIGAGRTELAETIFGVRKAVSGTVSLFGRELPSGRPDVAIRQGLGMVCEDRKGGGLFLDMSIRDNVAAASLKDLSRWGLLDDKKARAWANDHLVRLGIKAPSARTSVTRLSGGNQQKVLLAMWLQVQPRVLIVDEPTRGVDVGAKDDIHKMLHALTANGTAILMVSSDQAEVRRLADRILVLRRNSIVAELPGDSSEELILSHASGSTHDA